MGWEWGCWDDDITNVMTGIIPENSLRLARTSKAFQEPTRGCIFFGFSSGNAPSSVLIMAQLFLFLYMDVA